MIKNLILNDKNIIYCLVDKNTKVRSFKSIEHIRKKVDGPYFEVSAIKALSVTL